MKAGPDRRYTPEFRDSAVKQVIEGGRSVAAVARSLEMSNKSLANWVYRARKGQELVITMMLELVLGKERILTTYLNNVEWGEGVFGAQAASQHYFRTQAQFLGAAQAARLAVMLPAPKRFEKSPSSGYVLGRSATIVARMGGVDLPN